MILLAGFAAEFSLATGSAAPSSFLAVFSFFSSHLVDVLLVLAAGTLLVNGRLPLRLLAYGLFLAQFLAGALQLFAHYLTGEYLSRLAVENANHVSLLLSPKRLAGAAVAVAAALSVPLLTEAARKVVRWREAGTLSLSALSLAVVVALVPGALPGTPGRSGRSSVRGEQRHGPVAARLPDRGPRRDDRRGTGTSSPGPTPWR